MAALKDIIKKHESASYGVKSKLLHISNVKIIIEIINCKWNYNGA